MQKQKKQFILLCILLVVLAGLFFGLQAFNRHKEEQKEKQEEAEKITVLTLSADDITEFSYEYEGKEITFEKKEDTWYYKEDASLPISQTMIKTMLAGLEDITAAQQLTAAEDLSEYGFDTPQNQIRLKMGEDEVSITLGSYNEITGQYYLMINGNDTVYLVDDSIHSAFLKSVEDLTETADEKTTGSE